jgi:hypothetical protein
MSVGRNDPCPCGSGEKYKKCCLQKDQAAKSAAAAATATAAARDKAAAPDARATARKGGAQNPHREKPPTGSGPKLFRRKAV